MKYKINSLGELIIRNDSGNEIFNITNDDIWFKYYWYKYDYDQNDNKIYINSNYL